MEANENVLLTPALKELLQASVNADTKNAEELAQILCRSPHTIQTEYKRVCQLLNVHSHTAAVLVALKRGLVTLPPRVPTSSADTPEVKPCKLKP